MPNSDQVVITGGNGGGQNGLSRVQAYTVGGSKERLAELNRPRRAHACGYFYNGNNLVITLLLIFNIIILVFSQVYLVAGGYHIGELDSTELLTEGASAWVFSGVLPSVRRGLRAATLDNKLIVIGIWMSF